MPFIEVNGLSYYYDEKGQGSPLVLLHGFMGSSADWTALSGKVAGDFRTLAIDLPGHGRSASPVLSQRYSMDAAARDIVTLLEKLEIKQINLLGYSMGGRLALYLAVNWPSLVHKLILESASPGLDHADLRQKRIEQDEFLAQRIESKGIPAFVENWQQLPLFASQDEMSMERQERQKQQRLKNNAVGLANSLRGMGTGRQPSLWSSLPTLQVQTLLLVGALDQKFAIINRQMANNLPNAALHIVPDLGHNIHLENPDRFVEIVLAFLNLRQ